MLCCEAVNCTALVHLQCRFSPAQQSFLAPKPLGAKVWLFIVNRFIAFLNIRTRGVQGDPKDNAK